LHHPASKDKRGLGFGAIGLRERGMDGLVMEDELEQGTYPERPLPPRLMEI